MLSVHTSPLHQPGTGDAGGMNVYIVELSKRLADRGIEVEIFTRTTSSDLPPTVELAPGVLVRHITAGPFEGLLKEDLPAQLCAFTHGVLRAEAGHRPGHYDLVHSHYWLSGQVGWLASERWGVPLVHTMHTMAKVKNASLALDDTPEPPARIIGETQVVSAADRLIANTTEEAEQLVHHYDARSDQLAVVHPGVNLEVFRPASASPTGAVGDAVSHAAAAPTAAAAAAPAGSGDHRDRLRSRLGLPRDATVLLFAGRIQPLKAPDVLLRAVAEMLRREPALRDRLVVPIVGGPSGSGMARPESLHKLAAQLGISDIVRFRPPVEQAALADWYRAATALVMPSYSESFGLVALEAQACGTPVVAAAVGGLPVAVRDGETGFLVDGHDPRDWATTLRRLVDAPELVARMGEAAARHAAAFGWAGAAADTAEVYRQAMHAGVERQRAAAGAVASGHGQR
ncbi:glycosyltransferase [Streptacidiphilus sp. PB12-B1b]|uniref:glycosyltransferase n=1 Tax=Streptacidiphilus sp. PB12-B1b TaxID=2705012 RepID=UPI0015FAA7C3|nr:glycosyltransferase [Streptacidiphilus sp. PB12-B1b]QMU80691.1 glycosyltransferase [Streptacidiphilus sp. PB12-B1b]